MTPKTEIQFKVVERKDIGELYALLTLTPEDAAHTFPRFEAGQFAQIMPPLNATFLRRPISICDVDESDRLLKLLVRRAGEGSRAIANVSIGDSLDIISPLGNGFSLNVESRDVLLVGGGVGVAPLVLLGRKLRDMGIAPRFLLGGRSQEHILLGDTFASLGECFFTTDDGSCGHKGVVTDHPIWSQISPSTVIYCCGPVPMMKAVAAKARQIGASCEVSLENMMACGLGACLCCVEKTVKGNVCVCTEGPVFNINQLTW